MTSTASTETLALDRSRNSSWVDREAYPFRSRWLALPEGRLHYVDEGSGRRARTTRSCSSTARRPGRSSTATSSPGCALAVG